MLQSSGGELRKRDFLLKRQGFSGDLCSEGCRNGGENGAVVLGGSRDLGLFWVKMQCVAG